MCPQGRILCAVLPRFGFYGPRMHFTPRPLNHSLDARGDALLVQQIRQISINHAEDLWAIL